MWRESRGKVRDQDLLLFQVSLIEFYSSEVDFRPSLIRTRRAFAVASVSWAVTNVREMEVLVCMSEADSLELRADLGTASMMECLTWSGFPLVINASMSRLMKYWVLIYSLSSSSFWRQSLTYDSVVACSASRRNLASSLAYTILLALEVAAAGFEVFEAELEMWYQSGKDGFHWACSRVLDEADLEGECGGQEGGSERGREHFRRGRQEVILVAGLVIRRRV